MSLAAKYDCLGAYGQRKPFRSGNIGTAPISASTITVNTFPDCLPTYEIQFGCGDNRNGMGAEQPTERQIFIQRSNCREDTQFKMRSAGYDCPEHDNITALHCHRKMDGKRCTDTTYDRHVQPTNPRLLMDCEHVCCVLCACLRYRRHVSVDRLCQMYEFNDLQTAESSVDATRCISRDLVFPASESAEACRRIKRETCK